MVKKKIGKPKLLSPGKVAFLCERCEWPIVSDLGYLTVEGNQWLAFHDACRCAPGAGIGRIVVRVSRCATYELLLTTLASLAADVIGFRETNWPTWLRKVVADTQWYFSDGQKTVKQMIAENKGAYEGAGFGQQLNVKGA